MKNVKTELNLKQMEQGKGGEDIYPGMPNNMRYNPGFLPVPESPTDYYTGKIGN